MWVIDTLFVSQISLVVFYYIFLVHLMTLLHIIRLFHSLLVQPTIAHYQTVSQSLCTALHSRRGHEITQVLTRFHVFCHRQNNWNHSNIRSKRDFTWLILGNFICAHSWVWLQTWDCIAVYRHIPANQAVITQVWLNWPGFALLFYSRLYLR